MAAQNYIIGREFDKLYIVIYSVCKSAKGSWTLHNTSEFAGQYGYEGNGCKLLLDTNLLHVGLFACHLMGCVVFD